MTPPPYGNPCATFGNLQQSCQFKIQTFALSPHFTTISMLVLLLDVPFAHKLPRVMQNYANQGNISGGIADGLRVRGGKGEPREGMRVVPQLATAGKLRHSSNPISFGVLTFMPLSIALPNVTGNNLIPFDKTPHARGVRPIPMSEGFVRGPEASPWLSLPR